MPQAPAALVYERRPRPFSSTHLDSRGKRAAWLELCHLLGRAVCRWSCERPQSIAHLSSLGRSHLEKNGRIRLVCHALAPPQPFSRDILSAATLKWRCPLRAGRQIKGSTTRIDFDPWYASHSRVS